MTRYIFVAGGVMSGIGKGVTTASIGKILCSKGFKVSAIKIDPYINIDAGTMNPIEHGEVFVMADGTECDQDVGHYERFIDINLSSDNYITTGRVYQTVINRERNLDYKGKCVQVVPDIPNEVIRRIKKAGEIIKADFVLVEIGGTIGEYENILFLEAARIMKFQHPKDVLFIFISYLPVLGGSDNLTGEMKTKPTQVAVRTLNSTGIQPDIILARSQFPLDEPKKKKISIFCNIQEEDVISAPNVESIYEIPINFEKEYLGNRILNKFGLKAKKKNLKDWEGLVKKINNIEKSVYPVKSRRMQFNRVKIGIVNKYFDTEKFTLLDSYISIIEAIKHASWFFQRKPEIHWLSAENYEKFPEKLTELKQYDGIIVPGGFGNRGIEGKIKVIEFCRNNKIPYLGLCLGMQLAVVEFARNVCGLKEAHSTEFSPKCKHPVINIMSKQKIPIKNKKYGGTMRLGAYNCKITPGTTAAKSYKTLNISERHRHRYELNNKFTTILEDKGMIIAGINPEKKLVEIIEIPNHPFFVGVQFHPEFTSQPLKPHPLFIEFIKQAINKQLTTNNQ